MCNLELAIAEYFPSEYAPDSWKLLIPRYIAYQISIYPDRIRQYEQDLDNWERGIQLMPKPKHPAYPRAFVEACVEQIADKNWSFEDLAVMYHHQQSVLSKTKVLSDETQEVSSDLIAFSEDISTKIDRLEREISQLTELLKAKDEELDQFHNANRIQQRLN